MGGEGPGGFVLFLFDFRYGREGLLELRECA